MTAAALRELHARHEMWLTTRLNYRCADRSLVEEAVQDTFVTIWVSAADLGRYSALAMRTFELASVESHLIACARCRAVLAATLPASPGAGDRQVEAWDRVAERIDRSRFSRGVHRSALRFSFASPELLATTLGLAAALVFVVGVVAFSTPSRSVPAVAFLATGSQAA